MTDPNTRLSDLFTACWKDESMKRRLMAEPKAVLAEFGLPVPEALDVKVVENDENTVHITMPASPVQGAQLSDEELAEAAAAAAKRLQDEAISLEIQAEAASVNALRCDATYPEREVREW